MKSKFLINLDESYFGARRVRGEARARGCQQDARVRASQARGKSHVNGIENFWSFAKRRLAKFNGCSSDAFVLHLKECEWRYNHRHEDLLPLLKRLYKKDSLIK